MSGRVGSSATIILLCLLCVLAFIYSFIFGEGCGVAFSELYLLAGASKIRDRAIVVRGGKGGELACGSDLVFSHFPNYPV